MAEVGSIVNVSGKRIATPFGPPRPGSTPTKMPSTRPTIMSASVFHVIRTAKPWNNSPKASIFAPLITEERFEGAFRHDDIERDVERDKHGDREDRCGQYRLP